MTQFEISLLSLEKQLKAMKAPILKKLKPGIDLSKPINGIPQLSDDVKSLYQCKNGTTITPGDSLGSLWFFNFGVFISFDQAVKTYNTLAGKEDYFDKNKFPIFESGGGEIYVIECDPSSANYGAIYYHSFSDVDDEILTKKYDSLISLIDTIHDCFVHRAYKYENKVLVTNHDLQREIAHRNNPKSDYWKPES